MKQRLSIILFALGFFLISLVLTMPASQAYKWGLYPEEIQLYGLKGRVLDGNAKQVFINNLTVNNISWSWRPLSLLFGKLSFNWHVDSMDSQGDGIAAMNLLGNIELSDVTVRFNAHKADVLLPKGNHLLGNIQLDLEYALFRDKLERIKATAETEQLSVTTVVGNFKISPLNINVQGNETGDIQVKIIDSVDSQGMTLLAEVKNQEITLTGNINSQNAIAKQVSSLLPLIANKQGNNWIVSWKGILPL